MIKAFAFVGLASALVFTTGCGLQGQINDLKNRTNQTELGLQNLDQRVDQLEAAREALQTQNSTILVQLATLQGYNNIVAIKDPCGDTPGKFDEVFLQLSSGKYLASFSDSMSGTNTRFAVLEDGTFVTSDGTACQFTVSGNGTVISNEHN